MSDPRIDASNLAILMGSYRDLVYMYNIRRKEVFNTINTVVFHDNVGYDMGEWALGMWPQKLKCRVSLVALGLCQDRFLQYYLASGQDGSPRMVSHFGIPF